MKRKHLNGLLEERSNSKGFDELVGGPVKVHLEMMHDSCLWMSLYANAGAESITVVVMAKRGKLSVKLRKELVSLKSCDGIDNV